jgi:hypothetical protein
MSEPQPVSKSPKNGGTMPAMNYELFTSELTIVEASAGNPEAAALRVQAIADLPELPIDEEAR